MAHIAHTIAPLWYDPYSPRVLMRTFRVTAVFTALHGMQTQPSDENYVCLSVCLPNALVVTKWKKDLSKFLYRTKDHIA